MFRFTEYVMKFAPIGVGAAMAYTIGHSGFDVLKNLGDARRNTLRSVDRVWPDRSTADRTDLQGTAQGFFRCRQNSGDDRLCYDLKRIGIAAERWKILRGWAFRGGSSDSFCRPATASTWTERHLYLSLASVFVAQAAGVQMSWVDQILMVSVLMLTSKGIAGVPRASLVDPARDARVI